MVATIAAGTSAQYYLAQVEYYLGGREPAGRWLAADIGLGVSAGSVVERALFERLHAAQTETGSSLLSNSGGKLERVSGYDITFSAPKSASLLWALADEDLRTEIERAQEHAVEAAITLLDRNAAFCRRGKNGRMREAVRLTVAAFRHGEARPAEHEDGAVFADCALHHHACVLAVAQRADGSFGALDGQALFAWKMAAGAVYHAELARGLQRLGLAIENTGTNGIFEVAGVDPALRSYFSARRHQIEEELAAAGIENSADAPALTAAKARNTRHSKLKTEDGSQDRHALWRNIATARGFAPDQVVETAREHGRAASYSLSPTEQEALIRERVNAVPRQLTETQSVFEHRHLVAEVAAALVGTGAGAERARLEVERLAASGAVVALGHDRRWPHPIYSTPELIALERDLRDRAKALATRHVAQVLDQARVETLIASANLNAEQAEAAREATRAAALTIIEGAPGVGKTTLLAPATESWREAGWHVIGAASAWKIAHLLRDDLRIEARALDSWLARAERGKPFLRDRTLLVVDEAGLLSSRQLHRLLTHVDEARAAGMEVAVRLVGDRRQLQAIGGPGLRIIADAVGTRRVDTIVRQRESWAHEMVLAFGAGRAGEALALLDAHGAVEDCTGPSATAASIVAAWREARQVRSGQPDPLLIARTNRQALLLNAQVREALRQDGALVLEDVGHLPAVTPSGREYRLDLAIGDRLRILTRVDSIGAINGTEATLIGVENGKDAVGHSDPRLTLRIGTREVGFQASELADERGRLHLGHAYASTIYGAQGLTTERALIWVDAAMDRHGIHVAASRARGEVRLFVDRASVDAVVRSERALTDRVRPVEDAERRSALAHALSRSGEKASTLDYGVQAQAFVDIPADRPSLPQEEERNREALNVETRRRSRDRGLSLDV